MPGGHVNSIKELQIIIDHFDKYPLMTQKRSDYLLFPLASHCCGRRRGKKKAFDLVISKIHLSAEGIHSLIALKASMNKGLPASLKAAYPNITVTARPITINQIIQSPY